MDVNEDKVAPWKVDGIDSNGCAEPGEGVECGRVVAIPGMNDVTTATGCAVSRRSARIFWESPRTLMLLVARSKEDKRFAVVSASTKRNMVQVITPVDVCTC